MVDVHKPLAIIAHIVIFLGMAYTLTRAVLFFAFGPESAPAVPSAAPQPTTQKSVAVERIAAMQLFGKPVTSGEAGSARTESLQETRLSLELVGVFVADDGRSSAALIARKGRPAKRYRVGDRVSGNAALTEVHKDRVVISRGGIRELIRFEQVDVFIRTLATPAERRSASRTAQGGSRQPLRFARESSDSVVETLDELAADPAKLLAKLGVEQLATDGGGGYVIGAVADRPELRHTGLQRGDRIVSVNGRPVGDPENDRLEIEKIVALGSAKLEVERGERRFVLTFAVN